MGTNFQSSLQMLGLFFPKFTFDLKDKLASGQLKNTINVQFSDKVDDKLQVKVQIDLTLESENGDFKLYLQTLGFFKLNKPDDMPEEFADEILKKNTVAIMFPFIRSQVSLLTTQPGMTPILLQPIDVNALLNKNDQT